MGIRPFIFNYLVYGSADPIFHDLEKKKHFFLLFSKKKYFLTFFESFFIFIFFYKFSVAGPKPGLKEED